MGRQASATLTGSSASSMTLWRLCASSLAALRFWGFLAVNDRLMIESSFQCQHGKKVE